MPSELGQEFNDVSRYPYMAVASPSCHDTTTTRSWWEEDAGRRERFFAKELHMQVPLNTRARYKHVEAASRSCSEKRTSCEIRHSRQTVRAPLCAAVSLNVLTGTDSCI